MMHVQLIYANAPRAVHELTLELPHGSSIMDALHHSDWLTRFPEIAVLSVGIWGRKVINTTALREGDRVEFYRDLRVDPKVARRERFVSQGARNAGLFARRRAGSKAGY